MAAKDRRAAVDCLEKRISELERQVLTSEEDLQSLKGSSCLGTLNNVQKNLDRIGSKYSRIAAVWKRVKELEKFLSPEFLEEATLTDDSKADIIIAGEGQLKACADQLQQVEDLKKVVTTEPIKDLPTWSAKLQPLVELHIQQKEEFDAADDRLHNLLAAYNNIINLLSKQFVQWDSSLTQIEQAMEVKPAD
ncbi:dynactin subunit 3-like [Stylophora pistillata]|uniref:Dynactin subunit 3 n=1 Tax=Stylophora pistillata TaxID=50429 RepID=A0A2B4RBA2_STYPI|nr:dynactin subunit 3-like [Stylophora pistillata]PFX14093.1 Dynactin subunit 3 [Stylophora pistillata]